MSPAGLPHRIFIIRHAEKPENGDSPHLSEKGRLRAAALPRYPLPTLAGIFAARTSPESARPVETVTPLAAAHGLSITAETKNKEFRQLVHEVLSARLAGKDLLICWHHEEIPHLTKALGVNLTRSYKWADVYDRIWVVTYLAAPQASKTGRSACCPAIPRCDQDRPVARIERERNPGTRTPSATA
jgi:broad specificity phosphatase PhoE